MTFADILIDWIHLVASAAWIGGLIFISYIVFPMMEKVSPPDRGKVMDVYTKKFAILTWSSIVLLIITGFFNFPDDYDDNYMILFVIKAVFIATMILIGIYVGFSLGPKIKEMAPSPGEKHSPEFIELQSRVKMLTFANTILGIIVLFFAAALLNNGDF